jgi:hypothetical protein
VVAAVVLVLAHHKMVELVALAAAVAHLALVVLIQVSATTAVLVLTLQQDYLRLLAAVVAQAQQERKAYKTLVGMAVTALLGWELTTLAVAVVQIIMELLVLEDWEAVAMVA